MKQDLAVTRDNVLICLHDDSLERTSNVAEVFPDRFPTPMPGKDRRSGGSPTTSRWTKSAGSIRRWFNASTPGERIVTWQEAVDLVRGKAGLSPAPKSPALFRARHRHGQAFRRVGGEERARSSGVAQGDADDRACVRRAHGATHRSGVAQRATHPADRIVRRRACPTRAARLRLSRPGSGRRRRCSSTARHRRARTRNAGLTSPHTRFGRPVPAASPSVRDEMSLYLYTLGIDACLRTTPASFRTSRC